MQKIFSSADLKRIIRLYMTFFSKHPKNFYRWQKKDKKTAAQLES
jgi:hypothetical protein